MGVETKQLNKAVNRNIDRFPEKFRFQLSQQESDNLRFQNETSSLVSQNVLVFNKMKYMKQRLLNNDN